MTTIRVTKEFHFEAAHALWNYDGKCKHIHGHSYKLLVTVIGKPVNNPNSPKNGMVIDFSTLKNLITQEIIEKYDHALILNEQSNASKTNKSTQMFDKLVFTKYQPTCENMVIDFAQSIKKILPDYVKLSFVRLYETATSFAEWHAEDN